MQLKIQLFNSFCKDLKCVWNNFQRFNKDSYYVFQTYEWMEYWFYTVGIKNYSMLPLVVAVFDDEDVIAIFPLGMYTKYGVRIIEFIGGGQADLIHLLFLQRLIWQTIRSYGVWFLMSFRLMIF